MDIKETPIQSSFLGFVKRGICPICGTPVKKVAGSSEVLCMNCGEYLKFGDKTIRQIDPTAVAMAPCFAAPLPWTDMRSPTFGAVSFSVASAFTDAILTKREGVRTLDARWPVGCCVCGKPTTRVETINQRVGFYPPANGFMPRQSKEATVVIQGIPHCNEHERGARLNIVINFGQADVLGTLGLFFRSYAYQIEFRKLNPWKWRE